MLLMYLKDRIYICFVPVLITPNVNASSSNFFIARNSYASAVLGIVILSVRPSVRPSVTRVLCDETKDLTADILISCERIITFVF